MRLHSFNQEFFDNDDKAVAFINDWYSLGIALNTPTRSLSYVLGIAEDTQQHKITLDQGRVVYKSSPTLEKLQTKLIPLMYRLQEAIPHEHILSYRKGVNPYIMLQQEVDKKYLIKFDIKKCYDFISFDNIVTALQNQGFTNKGAKLVARLATVKRKVVLKDGQVTWIRTLQQGSPVSPVLSNIVGYWFIDKYVHAWIAEKEKINPEITWSFYRYSDNIAIFVDSPRENQIPLEWLKEFKEFIKDKLARNKFYTHKWAICAQTHPKMAMKFLGVILNKHARVEKAKYEYWRAILFNACRGWVQHTAVTYWDARGRDDSFYEGLEGAVTIDVKRFFMVAQGNVNYIGNVNARQGKELTKLLKLARYMYITKRTYRGGTLDDMPNVWRDSGMSGVMASPEVFTAIKTYRNQNEDVEQFLSRLRELVVD